MATTNADVHIPASAQKRNLETATCLDKLVPVVSINSPIIPRPILTEGFKILYLQKAA